MGSLLRHLTSIGAATAPAFSLLLQADVDKLALEEQSKNMQRMTLVFTRAHARRARLSLQGGRANAWLVEIGRESITETINWLILKKSKPAGLPT